MEALSRTFSADWRPGDQIMTWLKRREGKTQELSNLVRDGWSWTDVGRAMAVAGIHYRFGEPISAAILRKKASEARAAVRNRNAGPSQERASIKAPVDPGSGSVDIAFWSALQQRQAANRPAQVAVARTGPAKDEQPEFRPARLKRYEPARTQPPDAKGGADAAARAWDVPAATDDEEPEFPLAKLASHWSGTKIVRQAVKPPETIPPPARPPTGDADEVIARLLGKPPPTLPAAAPVTVEGKVQTSEAGPAPASPLSKAASLVSAAARLLEQTRAALRQDLRAPETAEERKARVDRIVSQYGPPDGSRRKTRKR